MLFVAYAEPVIGSAVGSSSSTRKMVAAACKAGIAFCLVGEGKESAVARHDRDGAPASRAHTCSASRRDAIMTSYELLMNRLRQSRADHAPAEEHIVHARLCCDAGISI